MEWHGHGIIDVGRNEANIFHGGTYGSGPYLAPSYIGLSGVAKNPKTVRIGILLNNGTVNTDSCVHDMAIPDDLTRPGRAKMIEEHIITELQNYRHHSLLKYIGAGVSEQLLRLSPGLCSAIWHKLDAVPIVIKVRTGSQIYDSDDALDSDNEVEHRASMQADSAVRKCLTFFSPNHLIRLQTGSGHIVEVDAKFRAVLASSLEDYRDTVGPGTWNTVIKYADQLKKNRVKVAYFSSTPQGGGVALMRHALMRFYHVLGIDASWYVPKPDPAVFRITKTNHNILQGVDNESTLTKKDIRKWEAWLAYNAYRFWTVDGGPLSKNGGADIVVIDDPQMPALIPLLKEHRPDTPVIYRSHIEIRSDLTGKEGSPQQVVWKYLWSKISQADLFLSHPVYSFIPAEVERRKVGLLPAATDWLDGLNKPLSDWDSRYYFQNLHTQQDGVQRRLLYPLRKYITQVARFDPSKGIPHVLESYAKLRGKLEKEMKPEETPQLLICGHGSVDDPDGSRIFKETMTLLHDKYADIASDVFVMPLGPSDHQLNAALSHCHFAVQMSIREGFEVKVSEALHKGKPVVATKVGGIPLQVRHNEDGFLIEPGDTDTAAECMYRLYTDTELYKRMSECAKKSVSDEVSTVGSAASWLYLVSKMSKGEAVEPNQQWIFDLARAECGEKVSPEEPRLNKLEPKEQ